MSKDKKTRSGEKRFVLINDIGNIVVDVVAEKSSILKAIEIMNNLIWNTKPV
jgi:3-dehydroquinate synthetase